MKFIARLSMLSGDNDTAFIQVGDSLPNWAFFKKKDFFVNKSMQLYVYTKHVINRQYIHKHMYMYTCQIFFLITKVNYCQKKKKKKVNSIYGI